MPNIAWLQEQFYRESYSNRQSLKLKPVWGKKILFIHTDLVWRSSSFSKLQPFLSVFHRPVTKLYFHLWKQLLSVPLFCSFPVHNFVLPMCNSFPYNASQGRGVLLMIRGWLTSTSGWLFSRIKTGARSDLLCDCKFGGALWDFA